MSQPAVQTVVQVTSSVRRRAWCAAAQSTALVAAVFCAVMTGLLVSSLLASHDADPLVATELQRLKAELAAQPTDDALKERIRRLDRDLREEYLRQRGAMERGAYLLLGGAVVLVVALKTAAQLGKQSPAVDPMGLVDPWQGSGYARWAVMAGGGALAAVLAGWAVMPAPAFPTGGVAGGAVPGPVPIIEEYATEEMLARNWPSFRGTQGNGIVSSEAVPWEFDGASGKGIIWKTEVPLPGHSSPIVWEDRVFLSGATESRREMFCFDARSGGLLWRQAVMAPTGAQEVTVFQDTGSAAGTMATDGKRVFAIFATGHVAAFDFGGKALWTKSLGVPESMYGYAASLAVYRDRLIIQYDQGGSAEDGKSAIMALKASSGEVVWKKARPVPNSWSSPIVARVGEVAQVIACGNPWVIAYNPEDGAELWRANCLDGDVAPSPAYVNGVVYVANERAKCAAIRVDGHGDVSQSHVLWAAEDGLPDIVSPLSDGQLVWLANNAGMLTCYDARKGEKVYEQDMSAMFHASPAQVGGRIYLFDTQGVMHVLDTGRSFKEIETSALGEEVNASPAFAGGRMYVRGKANLYCIGSR